MKRDGVVIKYIQGIGNPNTAFHNLLKRKKKRKQICDLAYNTNIGKWLLNIFL